MTNATNTGSECRWCDGEVYNMWYGSGICKPHLACVLLLGWLRATPN